MAVLAVLLYRRRRTDGGGRKRNGGGGRGDDEHGDSSYGRQQRQLQQQGQHPQQLAGSGADPNSLAPGIVAGPTAMAGGPKYYEAQQQAFREGMMYGMAGVGPGGTVTIGGPGTSSGTKDSGTASAATTASTSTSRAGALMSGGGIGGGGWSNVRAGGGVGMLPAVGEGEVELMGAGAFGAAAQRPGFSGGLPLRWCARGVNYRALTVPPRRHIGNAPKTVHQRAACGRKREVLPPRRCACAIDHGMPAQKALQPSFVVAACSSVRACSSQAPLARPTARPTTDRTLPYLPPHCKCFLVSRTHYTVPCISATQPVSFT